MLIFTKNSVILTIIIITSVLFADCSLIYAATSMKLDGKVIDLSPDGKAIDLSPPDHEKIVIKLINNSGPRASSLDEGGNFTFLNIPSEQNTTISWKYNNKDSLANYLLAPYKIEGSARNIIGLQFIFFRNFSRFHNHVKKNILDYIDSDKFIEADKEYRKHRALYTSAGKEGIDSRANIKHYRLLQEMTSFSLAQIKYRALIITKKKENIEHATVWFRERLQILAKEEGYFSENPDELFNVANEWFTFSMFAYTKRRNWPAKTVRELKPTNDELNLFRWKDAYNWLFNDISMVIELLKRDSVKKEMKKLLGPSDPLIDKWEEQLNGVSPEENIDLNWLANFLDTLNKARREKNSG
ncbi:MAG: hypothetical protein ACL93V_12230 [Candidatus Electrothrix sp. YB6]